MKHPAEFVYELKPGEDWVMFGDMLIVAHPEREPKIVHPGGREEPLKPDFTGYYEETAEISKEAWDSLTQQFQQQEKS